MRIWKHRRTNYVCDDYNIDLLIICAVHSGRPTRNYLDLFFSVAMFIVIY